MTLSFQLTVNQPTTMLCDASTDDIELTLPTNATEGTHFTFTRMDSSANSYTILLGIYSSQQEYLVIDDEFSTNATSWSLMTGTEIRVVSGGDLKWYIY